MFCGVLVALVIFSLCIMPLSASAEDSSVGEIKVLCLIDDKPVFGQSFILTGKGIEKKSKTDRNGYAYFYSLPDGSYEIKAKSFSKIKVTIPYEKSRVVMVEAKHVGGKVPILERPINPVEPTKVTNPTYKIQDPSIPKDGETNGQLPQTGMLFYSIVFSLVGAVVFGAGLYVYRSKRRYSMVCLTCMLLCLITAVVGISSNIYWNLYGKMESSEVLKVYNELPETYTAGKVIDNNSYIGKLSIPKITKTLPIHSEWSDSNSMVSPCRYKGSAAGRDLIIAGHNMPSHFRKIRSLEKGDEVYFTDVAGIRYSYKVSSVETISGTDVKRMTLGDWDLTLFTCTLDHRSRVTVRLKQVG